jgi:hypothetical protein
MEVNTMKKREGLSGGFTLIELLVVIAIIDDINDFPFHQISNVIKLILSEYYFMYTHKLWVVVGSERLNRAGWMWLQDA